MSSCRTAQLTACRAFTFPDGRVPAIRQMMAADVDGLVLLYEGLSVDDLRYRFFGVFHPGRRFLESRVRLADKGGSVWWP